MEIFAKIKMKLGQIYSISCAPFSLRKEKLVQYSFFYLLAVRVEYDTLRVFKKGLYLAIIKGYVMDFTVALRAYILWTFMTALLFFSISADISIESVFNRQQVTLQRSSGRNVSRVNFNRSMVLV